MKSDFPRSDDRGRVKLLTFARFMLLPENRPALAAVQAVSDCISSQRSTRLINPLYLHGSAGTGKTHLVWALAQEAMRRRPDLTVAVFSASDVGRRAEDPLAPARDCDLVVVEDLHQLTPAVSEAFVQLMDALQVRQQQLIFTANVGPSRLSQLPGRLTSRLAGGLVVGLETLSAASRLALLQDQAQRRQLPVPRDGLVWLAEHLTGSGRQLEGALNQLATLLRVHAGPLDVAAVAEHFREQADAGRPTIDRIVRRVGSHFHVEPRRLQSKRRQKSIVLPRQVCMYLARQLTGLSLEAIGSYFGGRDHSTVLHACRKVERALDSDVVLGGSVRQLHADLA
jgi:chromosomal replication initiator protein